MSKNESLLKKEFKQSDVQRVRNIVNKDYNAKTKAQTGYSKASKRYKEGDVWEENGKKWTIKNGIKQNVTKLDAAKAAVKIPLACPKCGGPMKHHLAKKMYRIHGFCFDPCTVEYEASLRKAGLYEAYEKRMIQGNMKQFIDDIDQWAASQISADTTFVTEQGHVEDWKGDTTQADQEMLKNIKAYTDQLRKFVDS